MKFRSGYTNLELHGGYRMLIHAKILKIYCIFRSDHGPWTMGHGLRFNRPTVYFDFSNIDCDLTGLQYISISVT